MKWKENDSGFVNSLAAFVTIFLIKTRNHLLFHGSFLLFMSIEYTDKV